MISRGLRRSLGDFRRHPWLHLMSVSTLTAALVIAGAFFLGVRNFESLAEKTNPQLTGTIYLKELTSEEQTQALRQEILGLDSVVGAVFKGRSSVAAELGAFLGASGAESLPGADAFPDVIELQIRPETSMDTLKTLKSTISKFSQVAEVDFSEDWLMQYKRIRAFLSVIGVVLLIAILIGCSFITANFMGVRHQARKHEIEIERLIGAHSRFILTPFLWEGLIEGTVGGLLAVLLLFFAKTMLAAVVSVQWTAFLGIKEVLFLSPFQLVGLFLMGMTMALLGSVAVFVRFQERSR